MYVITLPSTCRDIEIGKSVIEWYRTRVKTLPYSCKMFWEHEGGVIEVYQTGETVQFFTKVRFACKTVKLLLAINLTNKELKERPNDRPIRVKTIDTS